MHVDTLHSEVMTAEGRSVSQAGEGGQDQVNRKVITLDTPIVIREAPQHSAPGQSAIDSIKQAKQRLKK